MIRGQLEVKLASSRSLKVLKLSSPAEEVHSEELHNEAVMEIYNDPSSLLKPLLAKNGYIIIRRTIEPVFPTVKESADNIERKIENFCPDLLFELWDYKKMKKTYVVVEYKLNGNGIKKAKRQLEAARLHIITYDHTDDSNIRLYLVHGEKKNGHAKPIYDIQELVNGEFKQLSS